MVSPPPVPTLRIRTRSPRRLFLAAVAVMGLALPPSFLSGQVSPGEGCEVPHFDRFENLALSNGSRVTYFSMPVIVCHGGTRISADSAVVYEATSFTQLFRNVVFQDESSRLTADQAHYFDRERRLRAWGGVVLNELNEGSVIRGDTIVILRAGPGRAEDHLTVTGTRPSATLYPTRQARADSVMAPADSVMAPADSVRPPADSVPAPAPADSVPADAVDTPVDSAGLGDPEPVSPQAREEAPPPGARGGPPEPEELIPYEIDARRIYLEGSRYFRAHGAVRIRRDSVNAAADSVEYDGQEGYLFLNRDASLTTGGFDLSAVRIRLDIPQDDIRGILAREEAFLEGKEIRLLAPTISLFLADGTLERLYAVRDSALDATPEEVLEERPPHPQAELLGFPRFPLRPHAFAQDYLLIGDSVEVVAPGEVIDEVRAMGNARGESLGQDTVSIEGLPEVARRDWLEGDTIIAVFVPVDPESAGGAGGEETPRLEAPGVENPPLEVPREVEAPPAAQGDSASYRLERLIARSRARSLYRMAPSDSTLAEGDERRAIHYVVGEEITILMKEGEVDRMEVSGATQGIHLEPVVPGRRGRGPDSGGSTASGPGGAGGPPGNHPGGGGRP